MALKVGTRVRRTAVENVIVPAGAEGTVVGELAHWPTSLYGCATYKVRFDCHPNVLYDYWTVLPEHITPAVDPSADEWARDKVREITRPQPVVLQGEIA